ncbi:hypothetical protein [Amycolatopsis suaedae]|uniref:Uncharacterized protein n=1 Tax=Amycolatopsis suaedae TaxID=2510978 RepID=A0A4Q7JDV7_9PSEU|nr:hypothetical protein [Amycolatopsis suaedae]RZQ65216.1 hypothetical protein EWH70_04825 [Amycolatopsis suaedae]
MSGGYRTDPVTLNDVSGILRGAAAEINGGTEPPTPVAGAVTGAIVGVMAHLASQMNLFSGKLQGAADAVATGRGAYERAEQEAESTLPKPGPRPS